MPTSSYKLTPERLQRAVALLRAGNTLSATSAAIGVGRNTLRAWVKRGEGETEGAYHDLRAATHEAQGAAEARMVALVAKAAEVHWQAAAWWLERRRPRTWGRKADPRNDPRNAAAEPQEPPFWQRAPGTLKSKN